MERTLKPGCYVVNLTNGDDRTEGYSVPKPILGEQASKRLTRRRLFKLAGLGAVGLGLSQIGDKDDIQLEKHDLKLSNWSADSFRLALITDLHMDSKSKAERAVRAAVMAAQEKPDLILIGGDILSTRNPEGQQYCMQALDTILDLGTPVFAVLGNHEYQIKDAATVIKGLRDKFEKHRQRLLRNETAELDGVIVCGVDDGIAGRDRHDSLLPGHDKNVVTLFHEPDYVDRIDTRSSLMLAGHSHGGQMCLPFGISIATPRGALKYIKGYYPHAPVPLYVSRGVGTVGVGVRTFCPPEVTLLTLSGA